MLRRCTTCDAELAHGVRFCDACGAPVATDTESPVTVDQSRKIVTVLFADLAGSTPMQEQMDPEAVRAFNARYYAAMRAAVEERGGRIVKFVGDGVMAVFGVPEVAEDDAARALAAAVAMVDAFEVLAAELRRERGVDIALRIGVNTGEVVVDEGDDDVVGDAVNVAARLEHVAPRGGILVGEDTYRLTRERAVFEPPQELQVRGRAGAVAARVLTALDHRRADGPAVVFVGRDDELTTLVGALGVAEATNRARLVTIIGSPGVGKSRLLEELHDAVTDAADVFAGRCDVASASAFAPVAEVVRAAVDAAGGVDALLDDDAERERVAPVIEALVTGGEPGTPQETFWAVRRVIEAAARRRPVVVVLDDLHWAEPLLLDLVEHLAEWLGAVPVLLVAAARPELRELRPTLVDAGTRPKAVLALEGLDPQSTQRLAVELLGSDALPPDVVARIVSATEGNPLFVRELVRMLVDDGVLRADGDGWVVTVDARDIDVPPTISSLLAARVGRLRADERTVLERASVIGHEVYRGALVALLPAESRAVLDTVLESLRRKELLEPAGTYWIDEPVLRFHHALIREAAYRRLLKEARADLHERTADWLRAKTGGGTDHDEVIGFHLEQAQASRRELGPLDEHGRRVATEAATRLAGAAHRALDRDDLPAAATLSGRALLCVDPDDPSRTDMLRVRCEALLGTGDISTARGAVDELETLARGVVHLSAWATAFRVQLATLTGEADLDDASRRASDAAVQLAELGDPTGAAKAHRVHASVLARQGRVGETEAALDRALTAAREAGDSRQISGVLAAAPLAALWGPSPVPRAGGRCLDVVRLLRITTGARPVEAIATRCQAVLEALRGRTDAARTMIATARGTLEDLGLGHGLLELELFSGLVELTAGDAVTAEAHLAVAYEGFHRLGIEADAAQAAALRARAALAVDDGERALALAETAEQLGGRDLKTAIAWRAVKAEVLARRGQHAEAIALARAATELAEPTDALLDRADAQAALGAVLTIAGDVDGGQRATHHARSLYEQKGATALASRLAGKETPTDAPRPQVATPVGDADDGHENAATTAFYDFTDAMARGEASRVHTSSSFLLEDRRRGLGASIVGEPGDMVSSLPPLAHMQRHTLAVRGERLCLAWGRYEYVDSEFVNESISLVGTDADGRGEFTVVYDVADSTDAIREIDERYAVGDGAPHAQTLLAAAQFGTAFNRRDWNAFELVCTPDVVLVDHRRASFGPASGVTALVERSRSLVEVAPDFVVIGRRLLALQGRVVLVEADLRRGGGAEPSSRQLILFESEQGRVCRYESFEIDDLSTALARLEALKGHDAGALENGATRAVARWQAAFVEHRWDDMAASYADDIVHDDRRSVVGGDHAEGSAALIGRRAGLQELGVTDVRSTVIAVRGDRLSLTREIYTYQDAYELDMLRVNEINDGGQLAFGALFDPDDLPEALALLDDRYSATLTPAVQETVPKANWLDQLLDTPAMRAARRYADANQRGDLDALANLVSDDHDGEDRRAGLSYLIRGRAARLEVATAAADFGISSIEIAPVAVRGDQLALVRATMHVRSGEIRMLVLGEIDRDGLMSRVVNFDEHDLGGAIQELDARSIALLPPREAAAAVIGDRFNAAQRAGDAEAVAACLTDDFVVVDHQLLGSGVDGSDEFVDRTISRTELTTELVDVVAYYAAAPHGGVAVSTEVGVLATGGGFEVPRVTLFTVRDDKIDRIEMFHHEQFDAALARLAELAPNATAGH
jgi:class 3 adenylate cyclase/ketosteroid isomerase-like protein/tetratricopeptide (TPR) repeat protein